MKPTNRPTYKFTVPPTREVGSYSGTCSASWGETYQQNALSDYNSVRAHDGLEPLKKMPAGTRYVRVGANPAAKALGRIKTPAKSQAARENGRKGGRPAIWHPAPPRGGKNPKAELFRYTVVRLSDRAERFTDRKPKSSPNTMVWDNRENCEVR